jgi:hypothetical protein
MTRKVLGGSVPDKKQKARRGEAGLRWGAEERLRECGASLVEERFL